MTLVLSCTALHSFFKKNCLRYREKTAVTKTANTIYTQGILYLFEEKFPNHKWLFKHLLHTACASDKVNAGI